MWWPEDFVGGLAALAAVRSEVTGPCGAARGGFAVWPPDRVSGRLSGDGKIRVADGFPNRRTLCGSIVSLGFFSPLVRGATEAVSLHGL